MNKEELKLCPCCEAKAIFVQSNVSDEGEPPELRHQIRCPVCFLMTRYYHTKIKAIEAWNTRPESSLKLTKHQIVVLKELLSEELGRNYVNPKEYRDYREIYILLSKSQGVKR